MSRILARWRRSTLGGSLAILLAGRALSAEPERPMDNADAAILEKLARELSLYFAQFRSYEFKVKQETTSPGDGKHFTDELSYLGQDADYRYEFREGDFWDETAYDGRVSQTLDKTNGMLHLRKGRKVGDGPASNVPGLLAPFEFLLADQYAGPPALFFFPTPDDLGNAELWRRRLKGALAEDNLSHDGQKVLQVTLPGGVEYGTTADTVFRVFFDRKKGVIPVGWERLTGFDRERQVYKVDEFGSVASKGGETFFYPRKATRYIYYGGLFYYCKTTIEVFDVSAGRDYPAATFAIDPSTANTIHDVDAGTYTKVRK